MSNGYVTFNAGSSSLKFSVFVEEHDRLLLASHGEIENIETYPHFIAHNRLGDKLVEQMLDGDRPYDEVLGFMIGWVEDHLAPVKLAAIGHRVVHGGSFYPAPVKIDADVLAKLETLTPLAPLHQPHNLLLIQTIARLHPDLPQIACFDTSFHLTNSRLSRLYALPHELSDAGVLRYGFHGLSYEYIAQELSRQEPRAGGRVVAAHLGNGASMCAMVGGKSVASTMGFSALDGLPMGTRCGNIDPGILLYLLQEKQMTPAAIEHLLYRESGLLGVSGISNDMRELLASSDVRAREAVELFAYRIARELGSLAAAAGGLDVLVFTAGIGEHAAAIRARVCEQARWLGIELDAAANAAGNACISTPDSRVVVWVLPTNEELVIATHTRRLVEARR